MSGLSWGPDEEARFAAVRERLALVSTATACQLMISLGWRNGYMTGLLPLRSMGLGQRLVGRARTCRYLVRREPEGPFDPEARRVSPEIVLIESLEPGDIICIDALGLTSAGIIGDILTARIKSRGALAAVINGVIRDSPFIAEVGLPVFSAGVHPSHSGRELMPVDFDLPIDMAGCQVIPGDVLLADDEGVLAMPLDIAEYIADHGPHKEELEAWIRGKVLAGGSIHDYYPTSQEKIDEYEAETGKPFHHRVLPTRAGG
jgi:5-oxopent-3-ene-1,2,5-tricarboxylate decarboxylase / 2-hydroxyhepta-2,4-diene-1,7-dioate isomerase